ncbi:N-acetyltransferase [Actinomadura sp. KC345]|uniref:GNAT family N-acetyltransferase n=1 Tax=Actinomadura sp. KC345 TaxID=2530371 RepID=UPI00104E9374|nr:GNAT family protein [Actinomadura sp. KC345]TDC56184.1 N-acetyltransferase [Actinomadura sp. KC345]
MPVLDRGGAEEATFAAFEDNHASHAVSRKLGYRHDGLERHVIRGAMTVDVRLRLSRADWGLHRTTPVTIEGLEPSLPMLGLPAS